jgi:hypothetical protein
MDCYFPVASSLRVHGDGSQDGIWAMGLWMTLAGKFVEASADSCTFLPDNHQFLPLKSGECRPIIERHGYRRPGDRQHARSSSSHVVPST